MKQIPQDDSSWNWPTWWQWLVIVWLVILNATPYLIGFWAADDFGKLEWIFWSMLSGPFAHIGMLSFFLIAGVLSVFVRRLIGAVGLLVVLGLMMLILEADSVGAIAWFLLEAVTLTALSLASAWLFGVPSPPKRWWPQFSLIEILVLSGLLGVLLLMLRLAGAMDLDYWRQGQEIALIGYSLGTGVYLLPICLATVSHGRTRICGLVLFCVLVWPVFPLIFLGLLIAIEETGPMEEMLFLFLFYPAFLVQLVLVWGTFFPIRAWFPGVLTSQTPCELGRVGQAASNQQQPSGEQDFAEIQ